MYDFKKIKGEEIELIEDNCTLIVDEKEMELSVILTNMRVVFLSYPDNFDYQETLRISKGVNYMRKKEEVFSINIADLLRIENDAFDKYVLKNGNCFYLKTKEIKKKISNKIK